MPPKKNKPDSPTELHLNPEAAYRSVELDAEHLRKIDEENRSIDYIFSTETPVRRWFGWEILDHKPSSVRMERLLNGAPLMLDHGRWDEDHIGIIESAKITNKQGLATARFANDEVSNRVFGKIKDGIKRAISVGYIPHKAILEKEDDENGDVYRVTDWEPIENSVVTIGADRNALIQARAEHYPKNVIRGKTTMPPEKTANTPASQDTPAATRSATSAPSSHEPPNLAVIETARTEARDEAREAEVRRIRNIQEIVNLYPHVNEIRDLGQKAMKEGVPLADFQGQVIPLLGKARALPYDQTPVTELGLSTKEVKDFSVLRAVRALVQSQLEGTPPNKIAPFEMECSREIADKLKRESRGFFIPFDVQSRSNWYHPGLAPAVPQVRAVPMDTTENVHLVGTSHLAASFIDVLRAAAVVLRAGGRTLTGLIGNVDIPAFLSSAAFSWIDEDDDSPDTEPTTGTLALSPKTISGSVPITRRLLKQSSPDIEMLVRNDLIEGAALGIDSGAINGTGAADDPTGILATTGVGTETIATAGQPTWANLVAFEGTVGASNALRGALRYLITFPVMTHCKTTSKDTGSGRFLMEGGEINGYIAEPTTQMPSNGILFGNFNDVLVGFWGTLDINVDVATKAKQGGIVLRAFQDVDVGVRHGASFCKNA